MSNYSRGADLSLFLAHEPPMAEGASPEPEISAATLPCGFCGASLPSQSNPGSPRGHCSPKHRRAAWERDHPRLNVGQRRLDFLPTASELQHEAEDREAAARAILSRLQTGPATTAELFRLGGSGTSSRIAELRRAGHDIVAGKRTLGKGWLYILQRGER